MRTALAWIALVLVSAVGLAAGCGNDQALVGGSCAAGWTQCGIRCVDVERDPRNCAACGRACPPLAACIGGVCDVGGSDGAGEGGDATSTDAVAESAASDGPVEQVMDTGRDGDADARPDGDANARPDGDADASGSDAGDACPSPPYDTAQHCGDCFTACSGANDSCQPLEGGFSCAPLCVAPAIECAGQCVDSTSDPFNCGACGTLCASQLCQNSQCVGSSSGGIVFVGHDYQTTSPGTAQARILSNAVFIPQNNPLNLMSYERYANASAISHVATILTGVATQLGRTLKVSSTTADGDVPSKLTFQAYSVLLVHDQPSAPSGALASLGASWMSTLATFTQAGGVVVVLDGGTGVGEMPAFTTSTSLLAVSAQAGVAAGTRLDLLAPGDVVGAGVVSPYGAGKNSVSITTTANGGNIIYVVASPGDAAPGAPVVVHRVF